MLTASVLCAAVVAAQGQDEPSRAGAQAQRIGDTSARTVDLLTEWLGPPPAHVLPVDAPPRAIRSSTDLELERAVIARITRRFWIGSEPSPVAQGVARYTALRVMHTLLDGRHLATYRYFGGFVPYTIRSISWTPRPSDRRPPYRWFPELDAIDDGAADSVRISEAMYTLERYIGWPATQQLLHETRARSADRAVTLDALAAIASEQSGRDLSWFFRDTFRSAHFDYAVDLDTAPGADAALTYNTTVNVERRGDGIFSGMAAAPPDEVLRSLRVLTVFEDGASAIDWVDGRTGGTLEYHSAAPAAFATVDPDSMLLLDQDRFNNSETLRPFSDPIGRRLAWHFWVWLQDLALTYAAVV